MSFFSRTRIVVGAAALCAFGWTSCGSTPTPAAIDASSITADVAVQDQDASRPTDAHVPAIQWTTGPNLPVGVDHLGSFVRRAPNGNAYLYVIGGRNEQRAANTTGVQRAPIREDGSLGAFAELTPMPTARAAFGLAVSETHLFIVGGTARTGVPQTLSTALLDDGTLGPWNESPALPATRVHITAVITKGFVYAVGGFDAPAHFAEVYRGRIRDDGTVSAWDTVTSLPSGRSHNSTVVVRDAIYVVGGLEGTTPAASTLRAVVSADGTLGAWESVGTFPSSVSTHGSFVIGDAIYVVAGYFGDYNSQRVSARVQRALVSETGAVGPWDDVAGAIPEGLQHLHYAPFLEGRVYVAGGRTGAGVSSAHTYVGLLD